ncbi:MAG: ribosome small subunit-dependent GTPase A [Frankiaceae bacterium]
MPTAPTLIELGWSSELAEAFQPHAPAAEPARVARVDRAALDVISPSGPLRAGLALPLVRAAEADPIAAVTVGDWVVLHPARRPGEQAMASAVLPRRTAVVRGSGGRATAAQVLAANVDVLLLVTAALPRAPLNRVERFLTLAWDSGARPVVVLAKSDLVDDVPDQLRRIASAAPGADVVATSTVSGEGVGDVAALLGIGVTAGVIGASGAGKSSLANALIGADRLVTSHLREDGKGRHTTAWRELVVLPSGGVLLDTPGLRGLQLWDAGDALTRTFSDVVELAVDCRFRDCRHEAEPGCAVRAAIEAGVLDSRRVASHAKLQREQAWLASRRDALVRIEERRRWKVMHKQIRNAGRDGHGPRP